MTNVINIVDNLEPVNYGIWNAALSTANSLFEAHGIQSHLVAPRIEWKQPPDLRLAGVHLLNSRRLSGLRQLVRDQGWQPQNTIIATHGCWRFPTSWGAKFSRMGYAWIYCPHGMLEPWSLRQRWLAKTIYFPMAEKRKARRAAVIRAVGRPEMGNLTRLFPEHGNIELIPNAIAEVGFDSNRPEPKVRTILFLGRLHKKKCPLELATAFVASSMKNRPDWELVIAGPDQGQGQAEAIRVLIESSGTRNIRVPGPIFGDDKGALLNSASFFALPSHSEGFPTAVVEAMGHGCVPVISEGCNFPEAIESGLAVPTGTSVESIRNSLEQLVAIEPSKLGQRQQACADFIRKNYTIARIAQLQFETYQRLLGNSVSAGTIAGGTR